MEIDPHDPKSKSEAAPGWKATLFQPAPGSAAVAMRRAIYFLDLERSRRTGRLSLELHYQERLKSGDWGATKPSRFETFALGSFDDEKDREILGLLLSPLNTMRQAQAEARDRGLEVDTVLLASVLPVLATTGRLQLLGDEKPLTYHEDKWEFELVVKEDVRGYRVDGVLKRRLESGQRESVALKNQSGLALLAGGFFVQADGKIGRVEWGANFSLARKLATLSILVPKNEEVDFVMALAGDGRLPSVKLPAALTWPLEVAPLLPKARLTPLESATQLELKFDYGGVEIDPHAAKKILLDPKKRVRVKRRLKEERAHLASVKDFDSLVRNAELPGRIELLQRAGWSVELAKRPVAHFSNATGSLEKAGDSFQLNVEFDFEGERVSLANFFASCLKGERFSRLKEQRLGFVPESWVEKIDLLSRGAELSENGSLNFKQASIPLFKPVFDQMKELRTDIESKTILTSVERLSAKIVEAEKPRALRANLRSYQAEGLFWLDKIAGSGFGGILADDMGLGKTIQIISYLLGRANTPRTGPRPSLVVLPKSLVFNWMKELEKFGPSLRVLDFAGTNRGMLKANDYDVVVTTYHVLKNEIDRFEKIEFDSIILDEAQAIKNAGSQIAQTVFQLRGRHRFALSGTPVENSLRDLFSLLRFTNPGLIPKGVAAASDDLSRVALNRLSTAVSPFILRRTKKQVLKELPDKCEQVLYCDLEGPQKKLYEGLRKSYRESIRSLMADKAGKSKMQVLEALLRLRQVSCHPGLVDPGMLNAVSAKFDVLLEHLEEIRAAGHKALVFSQFTSLLALLKPRLEKEGIRFEYLDGQTRDRGAVVDKFNSDRETTVFLISLKAGGTGLNLTTASYVFLLDPWWNPAAEAQAIDRAYRMGQTEKVMAYRLIATGTIEERILRLQAQKRSLAEAVISDDATVLRSLSVDDLAALFED